MRCLVVIVSLFFSTILNVYSFDYPKRSGDTTLNSYSSPTYVVCDSITDIAYISLEDANAILIIKEGTVQGRVELPKSAAGLALLDRSKLLVAAGGRDGELYLVNLISNRIESRVDLGHTPQGVTLSNDKRRLYVANRFSNSVSVVDIESFSVVDEVVVDREPIGVAVSPDSSLLFVANHIPSGAANGSSVAAKISVVDTDKLEVISEIALPAGSNSINDIELSADGNYIYLSHILGRYHYSTTQLSRGWINSNALSILDVESKSLYSTLLIDDMDSGAANPWGIAVGENSIYIAIAGTNQVMAIDTKEMQSRVDKFKKENQQTNIYGADLSSDLSFLDGAKERIDIKGRGVRYLATSSSNLYVTTYFSEELIKIDLLDSSREVTALGDGSEISEVRLGEILFNDAMAGYQNWQSCASCHPGDGRVDGLNWDLLNDGVGNPKSTKSLLKSHVTPP